jgi:hypothetical protein
MNLLAQSIDTTMSGSQLLMLAMAIAGLTILMISTRKKMVQRSRESAARPKVRDQARQMQKESHLRRDLDQVMLELDQLSRHIHARIDTKFAKLEAVIRDADERIERLSRLTDTASGQGGGEDVRGGGKGQLDITLEQQDPGTPSSATPESAATSERRMDHEAIYRMGDAGMSAHEIAARTGKQTGEIELILSLRSARA